MRQIQRLLRALDRYQQDHAWLGFPIAVVKKYGDDQAGNHAALLTYYGFFSLFPLLLVLVTVLGFVLQDDPVFRDRVRDSALAQIPVIGPQIRVGQLKGSGLALAVGLVGALWGGMGVTEAAQNAMNGLWNVPRKHYPSFLLRRVRGLLWLLVLGGGLVLGTVLAGLGAAEDSLALKALSIAASLALNTLLFLLGFRVLTVRDVSLPDLVPGAVLAAAAWVALQHLGSHYVESQLGKASNTYGTFGVVIGLLSFLYLASTLTLYAAELNVVRTRRLWPRGLVQPPLAGADQRVLESLAKQEERRPEETVEVAFHTDQEPAGEAGRQPPERQERPPG